jgi:hypothetical protein
MKLGWVAKEITTGYLINPGPDFEPKVGFGVVPWDDR